MLKNRVVGEVDFPQANKIKGLLARCGRASPFGDKCEFPPPPAPAPPPKEPPITDRPIPFSGPMVRAIHEGRKTMTRRVLLRPTNHFHASYIVPRIGVEAIVWSDGKGGMERHEKLPYAPGDRLWVRESYFQYGHWIALPGWTVNGKRMPWRFSPDDNEIRFEMHGPYRKAMDRWDPTTPAWHKRLGRFMPRSASRTTLIVTDVKVERLQDISDEDAIAEGVDLERYVPVSDCAGLHSCGEAGPTDPLDEFRCLWTSINGPDSWDANPWVAAITFRPVFANIDSPEAK